MKYLSREDAPFEEKVWSSIDNTVKESAKQQMSGRRLLEVVGPYGLGWKTLPGKDTSKGEYLVSETKPVALIERSFQLSRRDIASFEETDIPLDLTEAAKMAVECARLEDDLIFNGSKELGVTGLLNASGVQSVKLSTWEEIGSAAEDVIKAVTVLDEDGYHGPYNLALAPKLYNRLYRAYPSGRMTELEHISKIASRIVKAPSITNGGVMINEGKQYASIGIGQDLQTGFVGPLDNGFEFIISESLALRLLVPKAVCVLK